MDAKQHGMQRLYWPACQPASATLKVTYSASELVTHMPVTHIPAGQFIPFVCLCYAA